MNPLSTCRGARPWLGRNTNEDCNLPSRLLIRTASNAYFAQVVSVLSLPDRGTGVETAVQEIWDFLQAVDSIETLAVFKRLPKVTEKLAPYTRTMKFLRPFMRPRGARLKKSPSSRLS
jgi:hypothetical protein